MGEGILLIWFSRPSKNNFARPDALTVQFLLTSDAFLYRAK
tara:strand:- start:1152 stop:1274 length:123 start_codon:yes stop_codon:yes gene_type:complete